MTQISEIETARQIVEIVPAVMQIVTAELRRADTPMVPTQLGVLTMLAHESSNLSSLAEQHLVSLPTMSNLISKMVQQGWVRRTRAQDDRRMVVIEITSAGLDAWQHIGWKIMESLLKLLAPIAADDREALVNGLAVLRQAFSVMPQTFPIDIKE